MVVVVNAVVIAGMWVRHGGLSHLGTTGGVATGTGQLTGLLGTYAVLIELLLMARLPWLERFVGLDRLAIWHRWTGFAAVSLLVAHTVLITVGYAQSAHVSLWAQTSDFVRNYADVLMAFVALGTPHRARGHVRASRAPPAPARDLVLRAPLRVPRGRARVRAPARGRERLHHRPGRARLLGRALRRGRRDHRRGARRRAVAVQRAASAARAQGRARGTGRREHRHQWQRSRGHGGAGGPVLPVALPHRGRMVEGAPSVAVGDADQEAVARHREGSRRLDEPAPDDPARHACVRGRSVRHVHRAPGDGPAPAPDRRRHRNHAAPRAARRVAGRHALHGVVPREHRSGDRLRAGAQRDRAREAIRGRVPHRRRDRRRSDGSIGDSDAAQAGARHQRARLLRVRSTRARSAPSGAACTRSESPTRPCTSSASSSERNGS